MGLGEDDLKKLHDQLKPVSDILSLAWSFSEEVYSVKSSL